MFKLILASLAFIAVCESKTFQTLHYTCNDNKGLAVSELSLSPTQLIGGPPGLTVAVQNKLQITENSPVTIGAWKKIAGFWISVPCPFPTCRSANVCEFAKTQISDKVNCPINAGSFSAKNVPFKFFSAISSLPEGEYKVQATVGDTHCHVAELIIS